MCQGTHLASRHTLPADTSYSTQGPVTAVRLKLLTSSLKAETHACVPTVLDGVCAKMPGMCEVFIRRCEAMHTAMTHCMLAQYSLQYCLVAWYTIANG